MNKHLLALIIAYVWNSGIQSLGNLKKNQSETVEYTLSALQAIYVILCLSILAANYQIPQNLRRNFTLWNEQRENKKYIQLEEKFNSLSLEQQELLVEQGLADKNGNSINLKFMCPISRCLITDPAVLRVKKNNNQIAFDLYDKKTITHFLEHNPNTRLSPLTSREIVLQNGKVQVETYPEKESFNTYINTLELAIDKLSKDQKQKKRN